MANIRKTFNFRNGVQVDQSNLLVNSLGNVGIGTSIPTQKLDVVGNVRVTGLVTATSSFSNSLSVGVATIPRGTLGMLYSDLTGIVTATTGIVTYYGDGGNLLRLPTSQWLNVNTGFGFTSIYAQGYVGVSTTFPIFPFQVGGTNNLSTFNGVGISSNGNLYVSGITTSSSFYGAFFGNGSNITSLNASNVSSGTLGLSYIPTLTNSKLPTNINLGIITATNGFYGTFNGNLIGIANTASSISPNINISVNNLISSGITTTNNLTINGTVGVNTNSTSGDVHIFNSNNGTFRLTSTNTSSILFGNGLTGTNNNGSLRYGSTSGLTPYSSLNSVDIINYENGSVNSYLHLGSNVGLNTGGFNWFYGKSPFTPLMTLTYTGRLGLGVTNPTETFNVVGTTTCFGNVYFGQNLNVSGTLNSFGSLNANSITAQSLNANLLGNVYTLSGISTFNNIKALSSVNSSSVLINTTSSSNAQGVIQANTGTNAFVVLNNSYVGVGTTSPRQALDVLSGVGLFGGIGVGSTILRSSVDFSSAGAGVLSDVTRFLIPPTVTTTQRNNLSSNSLGVEGAIIYNSTTKKHQGYGSQDGGTTFGWYDLY